MSSISPSEISNNIFEISEETIYNIIEKFNNNQSIDKTLTYVYVKAFYIHIIRIYLSNKNNIEKFEDIFNEYRNKISTYYKSNNSQISDELLGDILNAFDTSFNIIESLDYKNLADSYELRHHVISAFELLRHILEKKSQTNIRTDIFENNITEIALGLPKNMNNSLGLASSRSLKFKKMIEENIIGVKVNLVDERLTTVQATNYLLEASLSRKKRKKVVDGVAASIILDTFLKMKGD